MAQKKYYWVLAEEELKKNEGVYADFKKIQEQNRKLHVASHPPAGSTEVADDQRPQNVVNELLQNAQDLRKKTESSAWKLPFKVRKHEVTLRSCLKEVVKALKLFQNVGNVIASLDRVHAGIPWAAVNIVLEVSVFLIDSLGPVFDYLSGHIE